MSTEIKKDIYSEIGTALRGAANGLTKQLIKISQENETFPKDLLASLASNQREHLSKVIRFACACCISEEEKTEGMILLEALNRIGLVAEKDIKDSFEYIYLIRAINTAAHVCKKLFKK